MLFIGFYFNFLDNFCNLVNAPGLFFAKITAEIIPKLRAIRNNQNLKFILN
jgi:hypothetical protein